jgi:hypothetical protein
MSRTKTALREHMRTPQCDTPQASEYRDQITALRILKDRAAEVRRSMDETLDRLRVDLAVLRRLRRDRRDLGGK